MEVIIGIWQDTQLRQIALGLIAMLIISGAKAASEYVAENVTLKYVSVALLSAMAAAYSSVWDDGQFAGSEFVNNFVAIAAYSIGGYQTVGRLAKALFEQYRTKNTE